MSKGSENKVPESIDWEEAGLPTEDSAGGKDYRIELPVFEGPLDLLLHLIRKHEIDIFDIPISMITDRYLAYLEWMRVLDIDIASDFLVMAATLAHIKSRMLLPPDEAQGEEEEEEVDPRDELVQRLLEYQRYKEAAEELRDQPILYRDVFSRGAKARATASESPFHEVSVFKLIEAFDRVLKRANKTISHKVVVERISIADRIQEVAAILQQKKDVTFEDFFDDEITRELVVVTFLSLLEMARLKMIRLHQAFDSDVIHVRSLVQGEDIDAILSSASLED